MIPLALAAFGAVMWMVNSRRCFHVRRPCTRCDDRILR